VASVDDSFLLLESSSVNSETDSINNNQLDSLFEADIEWHASKVFGEEVDDAKNVSNRETLALKCLELRGVWLIKGSQKADHVKYCESDCLFMGWREGFNFAELGNNEEKVDTFGYVSYDLIFSPLDDFEKLPLLEVGLNPNLSHTIP
jgi:hypothetical protein